MPDTNHDNIIQCLNWTKDYLFPIFSSFFSALLGYFVALKLQSRQEKFAIEKSKLDAANKWILKSDGALQQLMAIKQNYYNRISTDPLLRLVMVPSVIVSSEKIIVDLSDLCFMVPRKTIDTNQKWGQLPYMRTIFENYNQLLFQWSFLGERTREINVKVLQRFPGQAYCELTDADAFRVCAEIVGAAELIALIDRSEIALALTDAIMQQLNEFLLKFPDEAEKKIDMKRLKRYGPLVKIEDNGSEMRRELLKNIPPPDYEKYSAIFGLAPSELKKRWSTGYQTV